MNDLSKPRLGTRRRFLLTLGAAGTSAAAGAAWWYTRQGPRLPDGLSLVRRTGFALGADVSIVALHEDPAAGQRALDAAFAELETVESVMSLYRPESQVCQLNRNGVLLNPHRYLVQVLRAAEALSLASDGAFDITVQPLWRLYEQVTRCGRLPSADEIEVARRLVDWRSVVVRQDRIELKNRETAVTVNGIAQGFAADRVLSALAEHGIRHALVNTGELGAMGRRKDGQCWTIGVQHPRDKASLIARAALDSRCAATSGDYETAFTPDFQNNHIFDPHTGRSPMAFESVTIVAKTGLEADALSTAVFVAGIDKGRKLVESTPGADAFFVFKDGTTLATRGFPSVG